MAEAEVEREGLGFLPVTLLTCMTVATNRRPPPIATTTPSRQEPQIHMMPTPGVPRSCTQQANEPSNTASHGDLVGKDKPHLMVPKILTVNELSLLLVTLAQVLPSLDMMVPSGLLFDLNFMNIMSHFY
ncbi:hypothetical protein AHAS_Ahas11G0194500 [Arachis hypogaea]